FYVTAPVQKREEQRAHTDHVGRVDAKRILADALGVLPHTQDTISLTKISGYIGIARILLERLLERVQTALPLPLPAIDITRIFERLRVVRLQLERAPKLGQCLFVLPIAVVIKKAERDVRCHWSVR